LHIVDCLITKAESLLKLGRIDDSFETIKKGENLLQTIKNASLEDIRKRKAFIDFIMGDLFRKKGDYQASFKFFTKSLKLWEELGNISEYAHCLVHTAYLYSNKGDIDRSIEYQQKALEIARQSKIKRFILRRLVGIGALYMLKGEVDIALDYSEQGLSLAREINDESWLAGSINNVGLMYHQKGDLNKALLLLEESLKFAEKAGDKIEISYVLDSLILVELDKDNIEKANYYLSRIKDLNDQEKIQEIDEVYVLNKAIILKSSKSARDRYMAENLLKKILEEKYGDSELLTRAVLNLCDLLLTEVYKSNDIEILNDLETYINLSSQMADQQQSYSLLTETYILKAKFALINMNTKKARSLLTKAQNIAEQHQLYNLAKKVSSEHDNLINQLNSWNDLREKELPLNERVELSKIDEQLNCMLFNRFIKQADLSDEKPILILILDQSGIAVFSFAFDENWNFDTDIFGGFLKAFNSFSDEIFSQGLDRAKFGQYTILLHTMEEFIACYLFQGHTYPAQEKIKKLISQIPQIPSVWNALKSFEETNRVLQIKDFPNLRESIMNIFPANIS